MKRRGNELNEAPNLINSGQERQRERKHVFTSFEVTLAGRLQSCAGCHGQLVHQFEKDSRFCCLLRRLRSMLAQVDNIGVGYPKTTLLQMCQGYVMFFQFWIFLFRPGLP